MAARVNESGLQIDAQLHALVAEQLLPGLDVSADEFWGGLAGIVDAFAGKNKELIASRNELQSKIDAWHVANPANPVDVPAYRKFLTEIGYLCDEPADFKVDVANVDREIAQVAAPQLVVPIDNARYCLNAANARWGSLFDALYGTDAIAFSNGLEKGSAFNAKRGEAVYARTAQVLDTAIPLTNGVKHGDVTEYGFYTEGLKLELVVKAGATGKVATLSDPSQLIGYVGAPKNPSSILFVHNGLHIEIQIDREHDTGKNHKAGVKDVILESAVSVIQDCEDSVAAVDAEDKCRVYTNWIGLMKGSLETSFTKGGKTVLRKLKPDREYIAVNGGKLTLPGRSVLLVRNTGIHMYTDAVLDKDGNEIPEGFLDALITGVAAKHDFNAPKGRIQNSRTGSAYLVKPKMHGPDEVTHTVNLFAQVEKIAKLAENTLKIGIMDEERRTTVNLKRCIYNARNRVAFINTGFLDRTGDEYHTSMAAGPMVAKTQMKAADGWQPAYEAWNVDVGLETGLKGTAQIGKGMWAQPDAMARMLATKSGHLKAGATCAWVPSPTAATLHALHYHEINVFDVQSVLANREHASLDTILKIPLVPKDYKWDDAFIQKELENNAQGTLGYVARWIQFGVGCSKVPNIDGVGLMEDRATLRISAQAIANWLKHGIIDEARVKQAFEKMAVIVDKQNSADAKYQAMAPDFDKSIAYQASLELCIKGCEFDAGYTEFVLHDARRKFKAANK